VDVELKFIYDMLCNAQNPEDVFGISKEDNTELVRASFRKLVFKAHPDKYQDEKDKELAEEAFKKLNDWFEKAQVKIKFSTYGNLSKPAASEAKAETKAPIIINGYTLGGIEFSGMLCDIFKARSKSGQNVLLKIPRNPSFNSFLINESTILRKLNEVDSSVGSLIVELEDSFRVTTSNHAVKQINVFKYDQKLVSLEDVINKYPNGIDPKDMAWMFKRCLLALDFIHSENIVHGAVLPQHILLNLERHSILLIDFVLSGNIGSIPKAIDSKYQDYYHDKVLRKEKLSKDIDVYMLGETMIKLLGGDIKNKTMPDSVPAEIKKVIKACTLGIDDAFLVHEEFGSLIKKLWGPNKWRNFILEK
jgi:serine/threonine protein kinase